MSHASPGFGGYPLRPGESQGQGAGLTPTNAGMPAHGKWSRQWRQQRAAARLLPSITVNGPPAVGPSKASGPTAFPSFNAP